MTKPLFLQCEYKDNPVGLSSLAPRFSWRTDCGIVGWKQSAYRILVASNQELLEKGCGDVWDSNKVCSDKSFGIAPDNLQLNPCHKYFWNVRVWNQDDAPAEISDVAWWCTGLLYPKDWKADWICASQAAISNLAASLEKESIKAMWIASGVMTRMFFRKSINIADLKAVKKASIHIQADNKFELHVNNIKHIAHEDFCSKKPRLHDITSSLMQGENVIAIMMFQSADPDSFYCTLRALVEIVNNDSKIESYPTDDTWKTPSNIGWRPSMDDPDHANTLFVKNNAWKSPGYESDAWMVPTICEPIHPKHIRRSHYFRRDFAVKQRIRAAYVCASALGNYQLYLNGLKIGDELLAPGESEKFQMFQMHDITGLLRNDVNTIGAVLGSGWYNKRPIVDFINARRPAFFAQVHIYYENGRCDIICTDEQWKTHPSPCLEDDLQYGIRYDARLEIDGWDCSGYNDQNWMAAECISSYLEAATSAGAEKSYGQKLRFPKNDLFGLQKLFLSVPPIRITDKLSAVSIRETGDGKFVFDFGQNAAGRCRLTLRGAKAGDRVMIRYAEDVLDNGTLNTGVYKDPVFRNDVTDHAPYAEKNLDVYLCKGGEQEVFEPSFAYTGFRYAELSGYPGKPGVDALEHCVFHDDVKRTGEFECSSELLTRLWSTFDWTFRSNLHNGPTDCPTREKRYYDGDAQMIVSTAPFDRDISTLFAKFITGGPKTSAGNAVGWLDAVTIVPWALYCYYGDTRVLEDNYQEAKTLVESRLLEAPDHIFSGKGSYFWGDHIPPEGPHPPKELFCSAFHYRTVDLLSKIAGVLGKLEDQKRYRGLLPQMAKAFNEHFFDAAKGFYGEGNQTSQLLPIAFGISTPEQKNSAVRHLVDDLTKREHHLSTGFVGTEFLLPVLSDNGFHEEACRVAMQTSHPSLGFMLENGATTIYESWGVTKESGSSRNHFAYGNMCFWFFNNILGIRHDPKQPAFKHFFLEPISAGPLNWANGSYLSIHGLIKSGWKKENGSCKYFFTIPPNTSATLKLQVTQGAEPQVEVAGFTNKGSPFCTMTGRENDRVTFKLEPGTYTFIV